MKEHLPSLKIMGEPHARFACSWHARMVAGFLFALMLSACTLTGPGIDSPDNMNERDPKVSNAPSPQETVRGADDPPIVTLQLGKSLQQNNLKPTDDLPSGIKIGTTNLNNVPFGAALQAVLADTDIALLWQNPELQDRPVTLMNLKGPLPLVVDRVCRAAKVICAFRDGSLEIMKEETFVVSLPPVPGGFGDSANSANNTISDAIQSLIEGKVKSDTAGGTLIYTTDEEGHERVQSYLEQLRNGRPLIVLQLHIWEVQLEDNKSLGINWSKLNLWRLGGPGTNLMLNGASNVSSVASGQGISLGALFSGPIDANALAGFLSKQGKVQNISSPQLTFVSGSSAKFEIGGNQRYVSQIGTANTVSGTSNTANSVVSTEELKTGLSVAASGSYDSGVVFATLELKTADLIKFQDFPAGGTNLSLPQTSDRAVQTVLRVRPGDNLVLAGLQTSRDDRAREGFPTFVAGDIPLSGSNHMTNSELVILVKPSVVFFSDRNSPDLRNVAEVKNGKVDQQLPKPAQAPAAAAVEAPRRPNDLQNEMNTVVKLLDTTQAPAQAGGSARHPEKILPENILPEGVK